MMAALYLIFLAHRHVIPQIVKSHFVVGAVGNVGGVGLPALIGVEVVDDQPHGKPQKAVDLAHPFRVALG